MAVSTKKSNNTISNLVSLNDIIKSNLRYNIPRYQRLYVWQTEQIDTLLEDLHTAYEGSKEIYYLGGILTVRTNSNISNLYDLIDGQQRFTTLWLLSLRLGGALENFTVLKANANDSLPVLRLGFAIRKDATHYFNNALDDSKTAYATQEDVPENQSLVRIHNARLLIEKFVTHKLISQRRQADFAAFICKSVKLLVTEVPEDTDLNKLFEVTNNRGVQLQHHEILKASILQHIKTTERVQYGKIWNACADMDNYIERNLGTEMGKRNPSDCVDINTGRFHFDKIMTEMPTDAGSVKPLKLSDILKKELPTEPSGQVVEFEAHPEAEEDELLPGRSILSFPQLLLHALRIYLFESKLPDIDRINEKELLAIFKKSSEIESHATASKFIRTLWDVRTTFDRFVIKWIKQPEENSEDHQIKQLEKKNVYRKQTYYLRRTVADRDMALLQSMLYHSQEKTTQYWLTPFLHRAMKPQQSEPIFAFLQRLEHRMFSTGQEAKLLERSHEHMEGSKSEYKPAFDILTEGLGTRFPHYWFYKLDFVLWYLYTNDSIWFNANVGKPEKPWDNFRVTSKNSVEHVSPQTPRGDELARNRLSPELLNDFGNLALVSRSINSEAGNKSFLEKRSRFREKPEPDSLKSAVMYEHSEWSDKLCIAHRNLMLECLNRYNELAM